MALSVNLGLMSLASLAIYFRLNRNKANDVSTTKLKWSFKVKTLKNSLLTVNSEFSRNLTFCYNQLYCSHRVKCFSCTGFYSIYFMDFEFMFLTKVEKLRLLVLKADLC